MSPIMKLALPVLAAAGSAYAASCSASGTATIQNGGDATQLASCKTFSGSIAIATGTTENIALDSIEKIDGNLVVSNNSQIQQISGDTLDTITGTFSLDTVQVLNAVNFPKLKTVDKLIWNALPNLQTLGFDALITKASQVDIENTQLQSLTGINIAQIDQLKLANNRYITNITMQLGNVSNTLVLEANNPQLNVSFPNLIWANNMTFRNCSSVVVPSLEAVNATLGFYGNPMAGFAAPNLTSVGGALAFVSNTELTNISLPQLSKVGGAFQIANNTKLANIDGFNALQSIGGAFDCNGNFSNFSVPQLGDVKGTFNLQSTGDVSDACNTFKKLKDSSKIQGSYECVGQVANPGGQGSTPTVTGGNAKKTGAASMLNVQGNALFAGLGAAAVFFL